MRPVQNFPASRARFLPPAHWISRRIPLGAGGVEPSDLAGWEEPAYAVRLLDAFEPGIAVRAHDGTRLVET